MKKKEINIEKVEDQWEYPGKFKPKEFEFIAFFYLQGQTLTRCQVENIDYQLLYNLNNFLANKNMIAEERQNFIHFKLSPGEDWLIVKNSQKNIGYKQCQRLSNFLNKTFNFKIKEE